MTAATAAVSASAAWRALAQHQRGIRDLHLRELFAEDPPRGERMTLEAAGLYPRLLQEPRHRRDPAAAPAAGRGVRIARAHRRHVPRREDQRHRKPRRAARGPARAARNVDPGRRRERRAGGARRAGQDGGLLRPRAQRRLDGPHRQAHPQRGQHRHRRLRPRAGDGLRGAEALQRPRPDASASSPTSTARISPRRRATSTRRRRCSSSLRRRSPRWRR